MERKNEDKKRTYDQFSQCSPIKDSEENIDPNEKRMKMIEDALENDPSKQPIQITRSTSAQLVSKTGHKGFLDPKSMNNQSESGVLVQGETQLKAPCTMSNFLKFRNSEIEYAFVDKTLFIKEIMQHHDPSMLILRPRRWGKSINLSMLYYYLSNRHGHLFQKLFSGTKILEDKQFEARHANKYPVIYLDFSIFPPSFAKDKDWPINGFSASLYKVQRNYENIIKNSTRISNRIKMNALRYGNQENNEHIAMAILDWMDALKGHYGEDVIILIDEYDFPILKEKNKNLEILLRLYQNFLSGLKAHTGIIAKSVITGCASVVLTNTLLGLNNFDSYSMLDEHFHEFYGFSHEEAEGLIELIRGVKIDEDEKRKIKSYYDGYVCPNGSKRTKIYNPYSIVRYADSGEENDYSIKTDSNLERVILKKK